MSYSYDPDAELIRFLYGETTPEAENRIKEQIKTDWALREKWQEYKAVLDVLNSAAYKPSRSSVSIILGHARETEELHAPA